MRYLALVLVGCSAPSPPEPVPFELQVSAGWYQPDTPEVTSVRIDGVLLDSGRPLEISEVFASYEDALSSFVTKRVVIASDTEVLVEGEIGLGDCWGDMHHLCKSGDENCPAPITLEHASYAATNLFRGQLYWGKLSGGCMDAAGRRSEWAARAQ